MDKQPQTLREQIEQLPRWSDGREEADGCMFLWPEGRWLKRQDVLNLLSNRHSSDHAPQES